MATLRSKMEGYDLSLLSLFAAHELEQLKRNEPSDGRFLSELGDRLEKQISDSEQSDIRNIAPHTVDLYRHAIHAAIQHEPENFAALSAAISELLLELKSASKNTHKASANANLDKLLAFVASLHRQLLAQKQRASASRNARTYRV